MACNEVRFPDLDVNRIRDVNAAINLVIAFPIGKRAPEGPVGVCRIARFLAK